MVVGCSLGVLQEGMTMMLDLIMELVAACDNKDKERAYRKLERVGVDRVTADEMAAEFYTKGSV